MTMPPYFVVYNPDTGYTKFQHPSYQEALNEAKRLAAAHIGDRFVILCAVAVAEVPVQVQHNRLALEARDLTGDEIPF